ncbi:uncharacterized protein B4U79_09300, partial [Dinothrombium tinctorium]
EDKSCQDILDSTDTCLKKIFYIGDKDIVFVKNETQLDEHCEEIKKSYQCVRRFGKCLRLFPKQVFTMLLRGGKKVIKERCDTKNGRKEFLKHTKCLRFPDIFDYNKCADKGVIVLNLINKTASVSELIPALCCAFHDIVNCLEVKGEEHCANYSGPGTGRYVSGIANSVVKDVIELSCGQRKSLEQCYKYEPKWMKQFDEIGKQWASIKPQRQSYLNPVMSIAQKLDSPVGVR